MCVTEQSVDLLGSIASQKALVRTVAEHLKRYITLKPEMMRLSNIIKQVVTSLVALKKP